MLDRPSWAPKHIDLDKPSSARIYNYLLGGACNAASDRAVARELLAITPEIRDMARVNRAFLRRVVPFLVHSGVRQFLDIGSGIPNVGNVHDVAQQLDPECRVVYVDNDPIAIAHSELLIQGNERAGTVTADFRDPDSILRSPTVTGLLDFDEPVAILLILMLHYVSDSDGPGRLLAHYRDALPSGSYIALTHPTRVDFEGFDKVFSIAQSTVDDITVRSYDEIVALTDGFELVEPGVVFVPQWRPESPLDVGEYPEKSIVYGAVARKT